MTFVEKTLKLLNVLVLSTQTHIQKLELFHGMFDCRAALIRCRRNQVKLKIKLSLFSRCDVEACNELWSRSPPLSA